MQLKVVFAKLGLVVRGEGTKVDGQGALGLVTEALTASTQRSLPTTNQTLRWFMPSDRGFAFDEHHVVGYYAYGHGQTYKGVDRKTRAVHDVEFPQIPYKGRSLFVLDDLGFLVIKSTTDQYIDPEAVMGSLRDEIRIKFDYKYDVRADLLPVTDQFQTIRAFLDGLSVLSEFRVTGLRKANPHPEQYAEWLDELAKAEVDTISQESHKREGISRASAAMRAQLAHIQKYGRLQEVRGSIDGSITRMSITEERTELTVEVESKDEGQQVHGALKALDRIREKLREL